MRQHGGDVVGHGQGGGRGGEVVYGIAEVSVAGKVFMNFEFIEGRQTRDEVV
jgi:hypothetical protein